MPALRRPPSRRPPRFALTPLSSGSSAGDDDGGDDDTGLALPPPPDSDSGIPPLPKFMIHPLARRKQMWDWLIILLARRPAGRLLRVWRTRADFFRSASVVPLHTGGVYHHSGALRGGLRRARLLQHAGGRARRVHPHFHREHGHCG